MSKPLQLLLVEDSEADALLVLESLHDHGFNPDCRRVELPGTFQAALKEKHWDVVLSDYRLPQFSATSALKLLQQTGLDIPFIVISGLIQEEEAVGVMKAGAHDFVSKNNLARLAPAIERELHEAANRYAGREAERLARATVDALSDHIAILDETGVILATNKAWRDFALTNAPVAGNNHSEGANYLAICDAATGDGAETARAVAEGIRAVMRGERDSFIYEYTCHSPQERRWFEAHVTRFNTPGPLRIVVAHEDISKRKSLEADLLQAQKMEAIGRLAGGVAHDFNNILTAISGYTELLARHLPAESPLRHHAAEIEKATYRASQLTRQLLAFGRKQMRQPVVLDLNALVQDVERLLRRVINESVELLIKPSARHSHVKADFGQIEQVILNLVVNARDAMPHGGQVIIETLDATLDERYAQAHPGTKPGDYVLLTVSDTGTGIPAHIKPHIFEPFFTTKGPDKGTGLGLATCYAIVQQSAGHINFYSEPDYGTTFKVYLPRERAVVTTEEEKNAETAMPRGTETILVVEDEPAIRELAREVLQELGYTVWTAGNGVEALRLLAQHAGPPPNLLVTDVVMPQMGGKELASQLQRVQPHVKILFTSGYSESIVLQDGVVDPTIAFLQKPYMPGALARKVRALLDAPVSA